MTEAPPRTRVLVVDDESNQRVALASMIESWGYEARAASNGAEALEMLENFDAAVLVTDLMMPVMDGTELLRRLSGQAASPAAIVLTAFGSIEIAVQAIHDLGAFWFLEKPLQPAALKLLLERASAQRRLSEYTERLERQLSGAGVLGRLVGSSAPMQQVFSLLRQVAPTRATVLITGESGTGKERAARALHDLSPRRGAPFVALNCAALPESLIESEMFGHEKGAFTGAVERRRGCFELAHTGTLLLDEIGEMPLSTQAKLLRVLEDRSVRRLGAPREVEVDVRVLASTNRSLEDCIRKGTFREDLFFRLNVFQVLLPPLRDRRGDIPALCESMIADLNQRHQCQVTGIDAEAAALLQGHDWPGNVRELRNVIERAVILTGQGILRAYHLPLGGKAVPREEAPPDAESLLLRVGATIDEAEQRLIELTLKHTANNKTRAAAILGISQKTLFNKLKEYERSGLD
jgi:DNA-binding NtrC family response regulator